MDLEIFRSLHQLWDKKPAAILLLVLGFAVFVFLVFDARQHKRRRKKPK